MASQPLLESLDFLYLPSRDVARDLGFYTEVLGGEVVFAIEAFGTRVAQVRVSPGEVALLLAGHLQGQPVLVHRVADLDAALAILAGRGSAVAARFEIPHGPGAELHTPGGQRLALYQLTRPQAARRLAGRLDFQPDRY